MMVSIASAEWKGSQFVHLLPQSRAILRLLHRKELMRLWQAAYFDPCLKGHAPRSAHRGTYVFVNISKPTM